MHKDNIEIEHFSGSSTVLRADYDHLMGSMKIYFSSGNTYEYVAVPYELFIKFHDAPSAGQFFHQNIRGKYDFFKK